jgi:DNA polymerase-1
VATAEAAPPPAEYRYVTAAGDLDAVVAALGDAEEVGLDTETTGLNPRTDRVRLLQLAVPTIDGGDYAYVIDLFAVPAGALASLFEALAEKTVVAHNALFDLGMLAPYGFTPGRVVCTQTLSRLVHGTRQPRKFHELKQVAPRELGLPIDKEHQRDDWSVLALSPEQLQYAARDASILLPLYRALAAKANETGQGRVAEIEGRCLPATAWLARSGAPVDRDALAALIATLKAEVADVRERLDARAPARPDHLPQAGAWNWRSPAQIREVFKLLGTELKDTRRDTLQGVDHPLAALLLQLKKVEKRLGTYGDKWLKRVEVNGRVYAGWHQLGSVAGRFSCHGPNLQQLPRTKEYRRCIRAPEGRVLLKADYSQIEVRIAAKVAGDQAMLDAFCSGADLHARTAAQVLGVKDVTPEHRQLAKALVFGLLYGMGAEGLRQYALSKFGVPLTEAQAADYRRAFFAAYPGLAAWHRRVRAEHAAQTRTLTGRRRLLKPEEPDTFRLNSPVQGTGADGLKLALGLLWERRHECPGAFPVLVVHDEVVVEADAGQAEAASAWLKAAMVDAMGPLITPVPCEVEVKIGQTWGG